MIQKNNLNINFAKGLDLKTDPFQVAPGNFLQLQNTVFTKAGLLAKRNGFASLAPLTNSGSYLTTFAGDLTAIGTSLSSYSPATMSWVNKGNTTPISLSTLPVVRNTATQTQVDTAIAANGLLCVVYNEYNGASTLLKYAVFDSITGQNVVAPTLVTAPSGTPIGGMRVYVVGSKFLILFSNAIGGGTSYDLRFIAINSITPSLAPVTGTIATGYQYATTLAYDAVVAGGILYVAYSSASGGQSIQVTYLTPAYAVVSPSRINGGKGTILSLTSGALQLGGYVIFVTYYDSATNIGNTAEYAYNLTQIGTPRPTIPTVPNVTNVATTSTNYTSNGIYLTRCNIFYEVTNTYGYNSVSTNYIAGNTYTSGNAGTPFVSVRDLGLASKAFTLNNTAYYTGIQASPYQPTYFTINGSLSTSANPVVIAKLAYSNGGGYYTTGLPSVQLTGNEAQFAYFYKDLIQAVNKNTNVPAGSQVAGIYSQVGVNLATLSFTSAGVDTAEIGNNLHLSGGFLSMYDGYLPVEHGFNLWPENVKAVWSSTGGSMAPQPDNSTNNNAYYYQVTYEWTDNQGNAHRSAPSIPVSVTTMGTGNTGSGSVTLNIPTLRLTAKIASPVKIVVYRWSVAQQVYYQTTSITTPILNDTTIDYVTWSDTNADSTILGNNLIYTTGGVVENIGAPACNIMTLFDTRLWLVDAEDQNLLWFSKQVIEATPVEMSDLFTMYVSPTAGSQGSTGPITALSVLDDKLVIFKKNAIYYINGLGPDNTGASNQYSQPIFVTSTVGCTNQNSIVFMPNGLMFQSDKGIWLLDRNLNTSYLGASVETLTVGASVISALNIPGTNQVRFTLSTGITLMYDYFFQQWGSFVGFNAKSSTLYQNLHTFINSFGLVYQESPGVYTDGSTPVLMNFTTGWMSLAGLQGFERAYFFYLLGNYISPHKLNVQIAYDFQQSPTQSSIIKPDNYAAPYGGDNVYGGAPSYGGQSSIEQWRIFMNQQKVQSFQITIQELFDPSLGTAPGAGLTLSGINLVVGVKKGYATLRPNKSVG